jgi:hypothetical protein
MNEKGLTVEDIRQAVKQLKRVNNEMKLQSQRLEELSTSLEQTNKRLYASVYHIDLGDSK